MTDFADRLDDANQQQILALGDRMVIEAADARPIGDDPEDERVHSRFEHTDLTDVDYGTLSNAEQREFVREKARRIRVDRDANSDTNT